MFAEDRLDRSPLMAAPTQSPGAGAATAAGRRKVDIEQLLQWAFLDELPKRHLNATGETGERFWRRMEQYGSLGGVDIDEPLASVQRYAYVGEPHDDAKAIEKAVGAFGSAAVDWESHHDLIVGELAGLINVNDLRPLPLPTMAPDRGRATVAGHYDRDGGAPLRDERRRTLLIASTNRTALVQKHAVFRSRPEWRHEDLTVEGVAAGRGFALVGECRGKNLYTEGSYCPLRYTPSPLQIVLDRADYLLWHQALTTLAETLELSEHEAIKPAASAAPWREAEVSHRTYKQEPDPKTFSLRDVERPRAGPPLRFSKHSKGRRTLLDEGE